MTGVDAFDSRTLELSYLWIDATYLTQREGGRIVSVAAIIAVAANTEGKREIVGLLGLASWAGGAATAK